MRDHRCHRAVQVLRANAKEGAISFASRWRDAKQTLHLESAAAGDDDAEDAETPARLYEALSKIGSGEARELFDDLIDELRDDYRNDKKKLRELAKEANFEVAPDSTFEQFWDALASVSAAPDEKDVDASVDDSQEKLVTRGARRLAQIQVRMPVAPEHGCND